MEDEGGTSKHEISQLQASAASSSRFTRSRTSRRPPCSRLILCGLRVFNSSSESRLFLGLLGAAGVQEVATEGISNHSSPPTLICLRKNGQREASSSMDSKASADEIGTGDDFMIACTTSFVGSVRRLRGVAVKEAVFVGEAKYL